MDRDKLTAPFPPELVRTRPGQHGKQLSYVPTSAVVARLNEVCDSWSFTIEEHHEWEGTEVVVLGRLEIGGVAKNAFGGSSVSKDKQGNIISLGDDLKAASSDALKKAASLFGVPIDGGQRGSGAREHQRPSGRSAARTRASSSEAPQPQRPEPPPGPTDGATVRQLTAIHAASRRRGFDRHRLSEFVAAQSGKKDVSHLSRQEASCLIDALNEAEPALNHHH